MHYAQVTSMDDVEISKVKKYIEAIQKGETEPVIEITDIFLKNLNIIKEGRITLSCLLVFVKDPQNYRPDFCI